MLECSLLDSTGLVTRVLDRKLYTRQEVVNQICIYLIIVPSTAIDCGSPSSPGLNGNVSASLTTFGNMATYNCEPGNELLPNNRVRTCQADGMWSGMDPFCEGMNMPYIVSKFFTGVD